MVSKPCADPCRRCETHPERLLESPEAYKKRAVSDPVFIHRDFDGSHAGVDVNPASGDGIELVVAERLVKSVAQIDAADMPVAGPSQVVSTDGVSLNAAERASRFIAVDDAPTGAGRTRNPLSSK